MIGLTANTSTTTQQIGSTIAKSHHHQHSTTFAFADSSDDEVNYRCSSVNYQSDSEDSHHSLLAPSSESTTLRLPSGKTIARKANGPNTSRHRHRRTPSPSTTSHTSTSRKVHGDCAMIPDSTNLKAPKRLRKPRYPATPPASDNEDDCERTSMVSRPRSSHESVIPRVRLSAHRTTIRDSDAQLLSTLPASTQRTLLATSKKAVEGARRAEQEYRGKLDGNGNLKSKERFVNDVPGGRSHKNRFMAQ